MAGSSSLSDITQLIRVKEQELQSIHDLRCTQLEKMVEERDRIILDVAKKFESLRDDFNYNLSLLEARDLEIKKLEIMNGEKSRQLDEYEGSMRSMHMKVDMLGRKNSELMEKLAQEKSTSKVRKLNVFMHYNKLPTSYIYYLF